MGWMEGIQLCRYAVPAKQMGYLIYRKKGKLTNISEMKKLYNKISYKSCNLLFINYIIDIYSCFYSIPVPV